MSKLADALLGECEDVARAAWPLLQPVDIYDFGFTDWTDFCDLLFEDAAEGGDELAWWRGRAEAEGRM